MEKAPYVAKASLETLEPVVLAVHCGDYRFRNATDEFLSSTYPGVGIDKFVLPGAIWWVTALAGISGKGAVGLLLRNLGALKPVQNALKLLIKSHRIRQVVLIGHQDCTWYKTTHPHLFASDAVKRQGEDLVLARNALLSWAEEQLLVSGYIATFDSAGAVSFQPIF